MMLVDDSISQKVATDAYYNWWENNKGKDFKDFKDIDPLEGTIYKWH